MRTYTVNSFEEVPAAMQQAVNDVVLELRASEQHYDTILRKQIPWLEAVHQEYFSGARGPDRTAWPPLAPSTIRKKGHSTILVDTRALIASLTGTAPQAIRKVEQGMLEFGTGVPYSIYHQQDESGGSRATKTAVRPLGKTKAILAGRKEKAKATRLKKLGSVRAAIMTLANIFRRGSQKSTKVNPLGDTMKRMARKRGSRIAGGRLPRRAHVGLGPGIDTDQLASHVADEIIKTVKW